MPITQDRMLALLESALDYQQGLLHLTEYISQVLNSVERGDLTINQGFANICAGAQAHLLLRDPFQSVETITAEKVHFSHARLARNNRVRAMQESKRRLAGVPIAAESEGRFRPNGLRPSPADNPHLDPRTRQSIQNRENLRQVIGEGPGLRPHRSLRDSTGAEYDPAEIARRNNYDLEDCVPAFGATSSPANPPTFSPAQPFSKTASIASHQTLSESDKAATLEWLRQQGLGTATLSQPGEAISEINNNEPGET